MGQAPAPGAAIGPLTAGRCVLEIAHTWDGLPLPAAERVRVGVEAAPDPALLRLLVDAPFHADPPPASTAGPLPPGPTPRLWEHEVVELFLVGATGPRGPCYTEVELGPHGHYLVLRLDGVRRPVEEGLPLDYRAALVEGGRRWQGEALLPRAYLPPAAPGPVPFRANAFAVHATAGTAVAPAGAGDAPRPPRRYKAAHPLAGPEPDFHQPHLFPPFPLPAAP